MYYKLLRLNEYRNLVEETLIGWTKETLQGLSQSVAEKLSSDIDVETWVTLALERPAWRSKVNKDTVLFEQNRIAGAQRKRELRKSNEISLTPAQETHQCPECGTAFRACIGLISHSHKHYT